MSIGLNKKDSIIIIVSGILMIIMGIICFIYKCPNVKNMVDGAAIVLVGSIFTLFGKDMYNALKDVKE